MMLFHRVCVQDWIRDTRQHRNLMCACLLFMVRDGWDKWASTAVQLGTDNLAIHHVRRVDDDDGDGY